MCQAMVMVSSATNPGRNSWAAREYCILQALTRLFWRNPAVAKVPRAWQKQEEAALLIEVQRVVAMQQRDRLVENFLVQVAAGADPAPLKGELAQQLEALGAHGGAGEGGGGRSSDARAYPDASGFSLSDWHTVAQQIGNRCAASSAVRTAETEADWSIICVHPGLTCESQAHMMEHANWGGEVSPHAAVSHTVLVAVFSKEPLES